jgi:hypothetical protein
MPHRKRRREQLRRAEEDGIVNHSDYASLGRLSDIGNAFRFGPLMLLWYRAKSRFRPSH